MNTLFEQTLWILTVVIYLPTALIYLFTYSRSKKIQSKYPKLKRNIFLSFLLLGMIACFYFAHLLSIFSGDQFILLGTLTGIGIISFSFLEFIANITRPVRKSLILLKASFLWLSFFVLIKFNLLCIMGIAAPLLGFAAITPVFLFILLFRDFIHLKKKKELPWSLVTTLFLGFIPFFFVAFVLILFGYDVSFLINLFVPFQFHPFF